MPSSSSKSPIATDRIIGEAVCDVRYYYAPAERDTRDEPGCPAECYIEEVLVNGGWIDPSETFAEKALERANQALLEHILDDERASVYEAAIARHERRMEAAD